MKKKEKKRYLQNITKALLCDVHFGSDFSNYEAKHLEQILDFESKNNNKSVEEIVFDLLQELFQGNYDMSWRNTYFGESTCENLGLLKSLV